MSIRKSGITEYICGECSTDDVMMYRVGDDFFIPIARQSPFYHELIAAQHDKRIEYDICPSCKGKSGDDG